MRKDRNKSDTIENSIRDDTARLLSAGYTEEDVKLIHRMASAQRERGAGKRGRDVKWTAELNLQLLREVLESAGGKNRRQISAACRILAEREPWRSLVQPLSRNRTPASVLRERFVRLWMGSIDVIQHIPTGKLVIVSRRKSPRRGGKYD